MTENKGLVHEFLGIIVDFLILDEVVFTMFDYLEDVIIEAAEDLKNNCLYYPKNNKLFKVDYNSPKLPLKDTELFHHYVARLLFISKRAGPDIQLCVAFLCTQVKSPTDRTTKNSKELLAI